MGFFDALTKVANYAEKEMEKNSQHMAQTFKQKLRGASDSVVLAKMRQTEEQGAYILYDIAKEEAERRGLI